MDEDTTTLSKYQKNKKHILTYREKHKEKHNEIQKNYYYRKNNISEEERIEKLNKRIEKLKKEASKLGFSVVKL